MNVSSQPKTLYEGTVIAKVSPVSEIASPVSGKIHSKTEFPPYLKDLFEQSVKDRSPEQGSKVKHLLQTFSHIFAKDDADFGRTSIIKHEIEVQNARPVKEPPRRVPYHLQGEYDTAIQDMLNKNVIEPSTSPWASGVVLVKKKYGSTRFCVDYRNLNKVTIKDTYPLPRIDDSLNQMSGAKWFCVLDLCSGYWQVECHPKDRPKTAFATRRGLYQFQVMPFGLCNTPATFERLMETVLAGLQWDICLIYLDDVIIYGKNFDEMIRNLSLVFDRLSSAGLKLKPRKCRLFAREVEYLGHVVSENGISTDPKKIEAVKTWPEPTTVTELRSFIGFCSYYRRFIEGFADIAKPLHKLTQKGKLFVWTDECQVSFDQLNNCLVRSPVLAHPDFSQPFILDTDASSSCIGAVLSQVQNGQEKAIAFASRSMTKSERKYCVTRKELLAAVYFTKYFRHYLLGRKFVIRSDHSSLRWLLNFKEPEGQMARWLQILCSFDMEIQYRAGRKHSNADGMSRVPCKQCQHCGTSEDTESKHTIHTAVSQKSDITHSGDMSLMNAQQSDRNSQKMRQWVEKGTKPSYDSIIGENYVMQSLYSQWNKLVIHESLLCREWKVIGTTMSSFQAIVPLTQRRTVLSHCHDIRPSGHLGVNKTLSKIRQSYYWPDLQNDVRRYVAGCDTCWKRKHPAKTKQAPMQMVKSGVPMQSIATDILGELPETENGNKYILVVSDYFTKWTEAFAMANMEAGTVARIMVEEVVTRFGVPHVIHSGQGRQYESRLFQEMCQMLGTTKTRTTPYHPKSDGMVERFNRTLETMLSAYASDNHKDWDRQLPYVMMAYRATAHETTGFSPNMLMLGRETSTPLDLVYDMPPGIKPVPANMWVWELRERIEEAHALVRKYSEGSILQQKTYHDKRASWERFEANDIVYVFFLQKKKGCTPKFTSFWRGPFNILGKLSEVLYEVDCGRNNEPQIIHCDRLKRKVKQKLGGESERDTDPVEIDREEVVEDIRPEEGSEIVNVEDLAQGSGTSRPRRKIRSPERYGDLFISRYVTFVNVSMYIAVYMFVYFFFRKHNGTHKGYTQKNKGSSADGILQVMQ